MYSFVKFFLFRLPAERAHHITTSVFNFLTAIPILKEGIRLIFSFDHPSLKRELWGLTFKNPVGLAAGFDKDGKYIRAMAALGFGFIEIGTVTPLPQTGNPKPRLFRLIKDQAIINRMGFNNAGVEVLAERLKKVQHRDFIIGGNIGKNKITPNEEAYKDYLICFQKLYPFVDYFVVNLSSPNTPGLRALQRKEPMKKILTPLLEWRQSQSKKRPVLVKIAPDLSDGEVNDIVELVTELNLDGVVATNTTIYRHPLTTDPSRVKQLGAGGLSGKPLKSKSTQILQRISSLTGQKIPLIGVGGIDSPEAAEEKMKSGADLIQIYTGFIYRGPLMIKQIKKHLAKKSEIFDRQGLPQAI